MMKSFLSAASAVFMLFSVGAAEPDFWLPFQDHEILVGNEKDGFNDRITGKITLTAPEATNNVAFMPYLCRIPEQNKILLSMTCRERRMYLQESTDGGMTWGNAYIPGDDWIGSATGLTYYGNGVLSVLNGHYRSTDYGKTWKWTPMNVDPRFGSVIVGWDPDYVFPDSDGKHILTTAYSNQHFEYSQHKTVALIKESFDAGSTWTPWRAIPEFFGTTEIALCDNGRGGIVAALRCTTLAAPTCDQSDRIETSVSNDGGRTWSRPVVAAGNGRHHPSLALLPDGRMVMTYVVRMGYPMDGDKYQYGIEAIVSYDGGVSWDTKHRYVLSRWSHNGEITGDDGRKVKLEQFYPAPQGTSTIYDPMSKCLITVYGTAQNLSFKGDVFTKPRQVGMVRWNLLDSYSDKKTEKPEPLSVEAAYAAVQNCPYWAVNYDSANGLPDCGWIARYPKAAVSLKNGRLHLDQRGLFGGMYSVRGVDYLEFMSWSVALRMRLNILPDADPEKKDRMTFYMVLGNGTDKHAIALFFDADAKIRGSLGTPDIGVDPGQEFLLESHIDPVAERVRIWIDGKLISDAPYVPQKIDPGTPAVLYFGMGTSQDGGVIEVKEIKLGSLQN